MDAISTSDERFSDQRFALTQASAARRRRNRPAHLLVVASVLLLGSAVGALSGRRSRSDALSDLEGERARESRIGALVSELDRLKADQARAGQDASDRIQIHDLEDLAASVGFDPPLGAPRRNERGGRTTPQEIEYEQIRQPLDRLVAWLGAVQERYPRMEVTRLELSPQSRVRKQPRNQPWTLKVVFRMWQTGP